MGLSSRENIKLEADEALVKIYAKHECIKYDVCAGILVIVLLALTALKHIYGITNEIFETMIIKVYTMDILLLLVIILLLKYRNINNRAMLSTIDKIGNIIIFYKGDTSNVITGNVYVKRISISDVHVFKVGAYGIEVRGNIECGTGDRKTRNEYMDNRIVIPKWFKGIEDILKEIE